MIILLKKIRFKDSLNEWQCNNNVSDKKTKTRILSVFMFVLSNLQMLELVNVRSRYFWCSTYRKCIAAVNKGHHTFLTPKTSVHESV